MKTRQRLSDAHDLRSRPVATTRIRAALVVLRVAFFILPINPFSGGFIDVVDAFQILSPFHLPRELSTKFIHFSSSTSSAASKWMENEKKLELEMDSGITPAATINDHENSKSVEESVVNKSNPLGGRWEEIHGNYILRPHYTRNSSSTSSSSITGPTPLQPRALVHFLGGALVGAAPQITYKYLLERLSSQGYLVVATPYQLSFDHLTTCDEIIERFELVAPDLAKQYGAIPVVGLGHSCGSLLHMLITSLFPDTPRAANAFISYNNRGVGEAVPFFQELIVPLFSDKSRNGSDLMKAMIEVAREKYNGEVPSDRSLLNLLRSVPTPIPGLADTLLTPSLVTIPRPLRQSLTNIIVEPTYNALKNMGIPSLLLQSLEIAQQIPKLIDEVEQGARDFVPSPEAMSSAARRAYRCRRTLLLQFNDDDLDDSEILEGYLKEAESVMKTKRPMIAISLERKVLEGNHLTPLLGPSGGEEWGQALEETLGGVLERIDGRSAGGTNDSGDGGAVDENSSSAVKAVRRQLGYEQVERVVDNLVAWLDEGSL